MKLWLDDIRDPAKFGRIGWTWVKTAEDAIAALRAGGVEECSLDHDLEIRHYQDVSEDGLVFANDNCRTGYAVALFLEQNPRLMPKHINVHSLNPAGRKRMIHAIVNGANKIDRASDLPIITQNLAFL